MDSKEASAGILLFLEFLSKKKFNLEKLKGIEMGCGKGRNVIFLAKHEMEITGLDFSPFAIKEAIKRAKEDKVENKAHFLIHDAIKTWPFKSTHFDFAIDCFATTDIESSKDRKFAVSEMIRVVKPKGYILAYVMSTDDEFHQKMLKESPTKEKNAFLHPTTGKFEKVFDRNELLDLYIGLELIRGETIRKTTSFFGKEYAYNNHWMIFQKH